MLSTKLNIKDLEKFDKVSLRIDNDTVLELSLFENELSIDIKTEHVKLTKSQRQEMNKFKEIMTQCDGLNKKDIVKCCEKYLNKCYGKEPSTKLEKELNEYTDSDSDSEKLDSTNEIIEKIKEYNKENNIPQEKMTTDFKEMWYDDPVDAFVKSQKELDSEIYKRILLLAKKWDKKHKEKMDELNTPLKSNHYKIKKNNGK